MKTPHKFDINQFGHKRCAHRLDMGTNVPPLSNKYLSEIFSPRHIKLTKNNPNNDFKSVKRPKEVEKLKLLYL